MIQLRARAVVESSGRSGDRQSIIVTELPYQVNKARLIEKIADLVREKKIEGIADLRDESDREGMRIVVDLKRDVQPKIVLSNLYKHTQMQTSFGIIMLAIVDRQPRVLNLREILREYLDFRREVVVRRTRFELAKAEERAHILEGLKIALDHIDEVVALIRRSAGPPEAKAGLVKKFGLSEAQAQAILEMRLQRLTGLERDKILAELKELREKIARYKAILADEKLVYGIIREELLEVRKAYADERRTEIIPAEAEVTIEDLIADEDMVITISNQDYIKRNSVTLYRRTGRNTQGANAMETKEEDFVKQLFIASTHSYVLFFSTLGRLYWLKVHEIEQAGRAAKGKAIVNLLALQPSEKISAVMPVRKFEERPVRRHGDRARRGQEDGAVGLRQPARRRDHRDQPRRGRRADRGAHHRRQARDLPRDRPRARPCASTRTTSARWAGSPAASPASASRPATASSAWRSSTRSPRS